MKLLARLEEKFPLACPRCGGDIRLIGFITDPGPIRKILSYLGEPLDPPRVSPARGPPVDWGEQVQSFGARAFEQPSPDDQPMIDIHHRSLPVPCPSRLLDRLQIEADSEAVCADDRILRTSRSFPPFF